MAKLTSADRSSLPVSDFAVPEKAPGPGSYPIPDKNHAKVASSLVSQFGNQKAKDLVKRKIRNKFPGMAKTSGVRKRG